MSSWSCHVRPQKCFLLSIKLSFCYELKTQLFCRLLFCISDCFSHILLLNEQELNLRIDMNFRLLYMYMYMTI